MIRSIFKILANRQAMQHPLLHVLSILIFLICTTIIAFYDFFYNLPENSFYSEQLDFTYIFYIGLIYFIHQFVILFNLPKISKFLIIILMNCWLCILPLIFYGVYFSNPSTFGFDSDYLVSQKELNKSKVSSNDSLFTAYSLIVTKNIKTSNIIQSSLPEKDALIFLDDFIILSPANRIGPGGRDEIVYIKIYNTKSGKLLFQFPKKKNLAESILSYKQNVNFKLNAIEKPERGIGYFDFWCSSVIGFKDNLIKPLRNWILTLNFLFISLFLIPTYEIFKKKVLNGQNKGN